jgi:hypothetical protein
MLGNVAVALALTGARVVAGRQAEALTQAKVAAANAARAGKAQAKSV